MSCINTLSTLKTYKIENIPLGKFIHHKHTTVLNNEVTCKYTFEQGTVFSDRINLVKSATGGTRRRRRYKMKTKQSKRII